MIYACDSCHFLFSRTAPAKQCPDCGKESIREATKEEIQEFEQRINANLWDEGGRYGNRQTRLCPAG